METRFCGTKLTRGIFLNEIKNRFLCMVRVDGKVVECYVPSSCRLSNFLELRNREVLLTEVASHQARTHYSLFAIKFKKNYIILNTSIPSRILQTALKSRRFSFLGTRKRIKREKTVAGYKCDLYIEDTNTVIEIKSIISETEQAIFPTVHSERAIQQLEKIKRLLIEGNNVVYMLVSLNPYVKKIQILQEEPFLTLFRSCVEMGMACIGLSLRLQNESVAVNSIIDVEILENTN